ncbi:DUF6544 family protein [Embleya sp. AB8]|uniref:DUF6544 family protein n=1 Tax=Embleya sp. AB8 TaxID=3156304 RepID=UPI003C707998
MRTPRPRPGAPTPAPFADRPAGIGDPAPEPPEPIRRLLAHTVPSGAPTPTSVELRAHGLIRVHRWWCRFESRQILVPPTAFRWDARVRGPAGIRIDGFDRLGPDGGAMHWRLFGVLPFVGASGADVTRSAAGRLAGEFVLLPAFAAHRDVHWEPVDDTRARARVAVAGHPHEVTVTVTPSGALASVSLPRWGNPDGGPFREHRFTATCEGEVSRGGFLLPSGIRAGWDDAEPFIRYDFDTAEFHRVAPKPSSGPPATESPTGPVSTGPFGPGHRPGRNSRVEE